MDYAQIAATLNHQWRFAWDLPVTNTRTDILNALDNVIGGFILALNDETAFDADRFEAACKNIA